MDLSRFDLRRLPPEAKQRIEVKIKSIIGVRNSYRLFRIYKSLITRLKTPIAYKKWHSNSKFKGCHEGERCFILGNGPSLKAFDLSILEKEFVFTVNNFGMVDNYQAAKTNVHIWADPIFYDMATYKMERRLLMENYEKIAMEKPICFFPTGAFDFIHSNKLDKKLNVNYFSFGRSIEMDKITDVKLDGFLYNSETIVHAAIQIAIYMGFKEIYLLGCDGTGMMSIFNTALGDSQMEVHAYDNDYASEENKVNTNIRYMTEIVYSGYLFFLGYKRLNEYCRKKGIILYNCSTKTVINEIPRKRLEDVL